MANNEIDSLSIGIQVNDNNSVAKLNEMSKAIDSLVSSLDGLKKMQGVLETLERTFKGVSSSSGRASKKIVVPNVAPPQYATAETNTSVGKLPEITGQLQKATQKATKSIKEMGDAQNRTSKATDKSASAFSKFTRSVGRIAFYRAIRTALKEIAQAFTEGIQNYARYDKATNEAMSKIMNSTNQLKNTLGVTLGSIMQSLAPVLENLIGLTTELFDNLNMALASLQGKSTYSKAIKQNEDYAKSIDKVNGKLLSFDTFNTLATDKGSQGLFEEVAMPEELNDTAQILKDIVEIIKVIGEAVIQIVKDVVPIIKDVLPILKSALNVVAKIIRQILPLVIQLVKPILELLEPIIQVVDLLVDALMPALEQTVDMVTDALEWIVPLIKSILNVISGLLKLATGDWAGAFESFKDFFVNTWKAIANIFASIINGIVNAFITFVNILIDGLNLIAKPINLIGRWVFGKGENFAQIQHWNANFNWTPYANGGGFNAGDAFIAGEKGAELVASSNRGGAVMNMEQLQSAIYTGMAMAMSERGGQEVVLKVDQNTLGRVVANSSGFINETNRIKLIKV